MRLRDKPSSSGHPVDKILAGADEAVCQLDATPFQICANYLGAIFIAILIQLICPLDGSMADHKKLRGVAKATGPLGHQGVISTRAVVVEKNNVELIFAQIFVDEIAVQPSIV